MIEVAAGVLSDPQGRVLLMQRLPGKHLAGLWEFPGGKLEAGEGVEQALARELREELGIDALAFEPLIAVPWQYPGKAVHLRVLRVTRWTGEPQAREGHPLRWTALADLDPDAMPAADVPIVAALRLPARYVITDGGNDVAGLRPRDAPTTGLGPDLPLVQLRIPGAGRVEVERVAAVWLANDASLRGRLLVNHDIGLAERLGVGVQLRATQLRELRERPLPRGAWVGASCHDAAELAHAVRIGADFATLSPVNHTASHPDATPLGWERFAQWVAAVPLPVYALGGVGPGDLGRARAAGGQGVAGIRAFARLGMEDG